MQDIRKLNVTGNGKSYYFTIPRWMIEKLKWRKGQKVEIKLKGDKVVVGDWKGK